MKRFVRYFLSLSLLMAVSACDNDAALYSNPNKYSASNESEKIIAPPPPSPCLDERDRLCAFEYSDEDQKERARIKQANANLPNSKEDICDVSQYQEIIFEPFERELFPAIKADQIDKSDPIRAGPWKAGSIHSDSPTIDIDSYNPEPSSGGTQAIIAFGSVAEINVSDEKFFFAKDIVVKPDDHPSWDGPSLFYFGYYEKRAAFENMSWSRSNHLSFGQYKANDKGHIVNPWITKMMRTYEHLHNGLYGDRELRYQHYRNSGTVVDREFQDFGYNYAPNHIVDGNAIGIFPDYEIDDISLDSDIFDNIEQYQLLYQSKLYVSDNIIYIETNQPRHIIAKITADRPIAEYKICPTISGQPTAINRLEALEEE